MRASNDQIRQTYELTLLGLTQEHIARVLGVSSVLFDQWVATDPNIREALAQGGELANAKVAEALYRCAVGYTYEDRYFASFRGEIFSEPIIKHKLPDPKAAELWLKNRNADLWRDKQSEDKNREDYENYTDEELERRVEESFKNVAT